LTMKHHLRFQCQFQELLKNNIPNAIISNSNSTIDITNNVHVNDQSKYMYISYHFTPNQVEAWKITVYYVQSSENIEDICTKGLSWEILECFYKTIFCIK
jgi:ABC-type transporter MlaC component